mmetsp:Transcript_9605/g.27238  ORF Transcript_9605/g.27238 Transcript_9605/m.27238 type:complete len:245 (-) Transcript_9605:9-743(-)
MSSPDHWLQCPGFNLLHTTTLHACPLQRLPVPQDPLKSVAAFSPIATPATRPLTPSTTLVPHDSSRPDKTNSKHHPGSAARAPPRNASPHQNRIARTPVEAGVKCDGTRTGPLPLRDGGPPAACAETPTAVEENADPSALSVKATFGGRSGNGGAEAVHGVLGPEATAEPSAAEGSAAPDPHRGDPPVKPRSASAPRGASQDERKAGSIAEPDDACGHRIPCERSNRCSPGGGSGHRTTRPPPK